MSNRQISIHLPNSLLRLGVLLMIACIGVFAFISWLLEYKDTVVGDITITTQQIPLDIHANATGKLRLLQADNALVTKGMPLAYIENSAKLEDCLILVEQLKTAQPTDHSFQQIPILLSAMEGKNIGAIQPALVNLSTQYKAYRIFLQNDKHEAVIASKKEQIQLYQDHIQLSEQKIQLHDDNLALVKEQVAVDAQLFEENVISERSLKESEQAYNQLNLSGRLIDFQTAISTAKIQIEQQEEAILQINSAYLLEKEQLQKKIVDAYQLLQNKVTAWKEVYLAEADMDGTLVYSDYLSNYEFVQKGTKMMTIAPTGATTYLGLLQLPMAGFSKVKKDQPVHIRLDHYPYTEYGILKGKVTAMAAIPNNNTYTVQVAFPEGLTSTYDVDFEFNQLMSGQAEVVTNRMSLWSRVQNQMRSAQLNN